MHYFKGSMSEWDIKWKLSWKNLMLYIASIPGGDSETSTDTTTAIEVKDASELF